MKTFNTSYSLNCVMIRVIESNIFIFYTPYKKTQQNHWCRLCGWLRNFAIWIFHETLCYARNSRDEISSTTLPLIEEGKMSLIICELILVWVQYMWKIGNWPLLLVLEKNALQITQFATQISLWFFMWYCICIFKSIFLNYNIVKSCW
jgi:hypothetical protein